MKTPDELCRTAADAGLKVSVRDLEELIMIEGTPEALEFLGRLLIAQAHFEKDSGFQIGPSTAGTAQGDILSEYPN
jgi:hypothetical protein